MKPIQSRRGIPFIVTLSYFISFLAIRLAVIVAGSAESQFAMAAKAGNMPEQSFYIGRNIILFGYHIHHFYFGIFLIAAAGWIALIESPHFSRRQIAVIYGAGLGLFMDEIGLLLTWGDYHSSLTYVLSLLLAGVFVNLVFFPDFWKETRRQIRANPPRSALLNALFLKTQLPKVADNLTKATGKTELASLVFTGIMYLGVGVLILLYPRFVYYWVAGVFLLQGVTSLVRAWKENSSGEEEEEDAI